MFYLILFLILIKFKKIKSILNHKGCNFAYVDGNKSKIEVFVLCHYSFKGRDRLCLGIKKCDFRDAVLEAYRKEDEYSERTRDNITNCLKKLYVYGCD